MADCISMAAAELDRLAITSVGSNATEERLGALEEKINMWSTDESMIWDREPEEASEYLQVVDEIRILTEDLESSQSNAKVEGHVRLLGRAHSSLQTAMARLEDEFAHLLITECHEVLLRLGEFVRGNLTEFKSAIHSNTSTTPFASGGVHPLTKYVMNYSKALTAYNSTLISILENQNRNDLYTVVEDDGEANSGFSPIVPHLQSMISLLETNLEGRSTLYRDSALQSFFLMNNIFYMVQKVKDSDLRIFLGDEWIRTHNRKFQQHAMAYERASWTLVLSFLKDEGISNPGSSSYSKTVLKERFKRFNLALEEVYRAQTAWLIPDLGLREDLRISVSLKVLQAYRTFMGRYSGQLSGVRQRDKYIKYWPDDLEKFLLDLFEGSPKVLH